MTFLGCVILFLAGFFNGFIFRGVLDCYGRRHDAACEEQVRAAREEGEGSHDLP